MVSSFPSCRSKTLNLERLKSKLRQEFDTTENEDKLIAEYKKEMELLLQEKMAHVEELRLIHADINLVNGNLLLKSKDIFWIRKHSFKYKWMLLITSGTCTVELYLFQLLSGFHSVKNLLSKTKIVIIKF